MATTWTALFLGNFTTQMDEVERYSVSENASYFSNMTFGDAANPVGQERVAVTAIDQSGRTGVLDTDNRETNDQLSYDLGSGTETNMFDAIAVYNATLTYTDGTTGTVTAVVIQDDSGNLFLAPEIAPNADSVAYQAKPIESITLGTVISNNAVLVADRYEETFVCFVQGTLIETPTGQRPVDSLEVGDLVCTADGGAQPIRWIRKREAEGQGRGAPIRIAAGSLGGGRPWRDLYVSRQHRMLVRNPVTQGMFGCPEVLVPAFRLCGLPGIDEAATESPVVYYHFLLDHHAIVWGEGAPTESLLAGPMTLRAMRPVDLLEFLAQSPSDAQRAPARLIPKPKEQRALVADLLAADMQILTDCSAPVPSRHPHIPAATDMT